MSQIVKQTISVRSGNGRRTDVPTVPPCESFLARMGLLMPRSVSAGAFASVAEYGNMDASKSPRYAFIFIPNHSGPRQSTAISHWRDFRLPLRRLFTIPRSRYGEHSG